VSVEYTAEGICCKEDNISECRIYICCKDYNIEIDIFKQAMFI
jgi:hypothetical protein